MKSNTIHMKTTYRTPVAKEIIIESNCPLCQSLNGSLYGGSFGSSGGAGAPQDPDNVLDGGSF